MFLSRPSIFCYRALSHEPFHRRRKDFICSPLQNPPARFKNKKRLLENTINLDNSGKWVMNIWEFVVLSNFESPGNSHNNKVCQRCGGGFYKQNTQQHPRQTAKSIGSYHHLFSLSALTMRSVDLQGKISSS